MVSNEVSNGSRSRFKYVSMLIVIAILTFICTYIFLYMSKPVVYQGVKVDGIEVGGMTVDELEEFLKQLYAHTDQEIILNVLDKQYNVTLSDIGYYDFKNAAEQAYKFGREGSIFSRLKNIAYARTGKLYINFDVKPAVDDKRATEILEKIAKEINRPAVNADIVFKGNDVIEVIPHQVGYEVDIEASLDNLKKKFTDGEVNLPVKEVEPRITSQMLASVKDIVSQYSTVFNPADVNRTLNLQTAANAINGYILLPGEEFSLNKVLGPRIKENGYLEAPVIINGKLVPDYGGGVCQIATTVFNAAVRANLDITERHHHSFPVAYVPVGQDATISGDILDFRFKNNSKYPIYMRAYIKANRFYVDIYGNNTSPGLNIHLSTEVLNVVEPVTEYKEDKTLPPGAQVMEREPHKGYKVNVYKLTYDKNNKLLEKKLLYTDTYKPVNGIVRRNSDVPMLNNMSDAQSSKPAL
ncbi:MAG: VanW family protein [Thermoanaerobacteraceae bacterium]|nr:VanW family protein [Thermoanaerobacteraceae bacterium]